MKLLLSAMFVGSVMGQTVIPSGVPAGYGFDGRVEEWQGLAPTFRLRPSAAGGREAAVWVRQAAEGLVIAGMVHGSAPDFAASAEEMLRKDHVEIWVAPEKPPGLPPVGWVNLLGESLAGSLAACVKAAGQDGGYEGKETPAEDCRVWLAAVAAHRRLLARLFARQYGLSPEVTVEAYATPAWDKMEEREQGSAAALQPSGRPVFRAVTVEGGYSFEALLPWESLPPLGELKLKRLRLMVDVFSAHEGAAKEQPFSTSSAVRKYGDLTTLNVVTLAEGREYRITDCEFPLEGLRLYNQAETAVFRPGQELKLAEVVVFANGGATRAMRPEGESPTVSTAEYAQKPMGEKVTACGSADMEDKRFGWRDAGGARRWEEAVDMETVAAKAQPDGAYLVKWGPKLSTRPFAEQFDKLNPCWDCQVADLHLFRLGVQGEPKAMFDFHEAAGAIDTIPGGNDLDVQVSSDWEKITIYREVDAEDGAAGGAAGKHWTSESFCREAGGYTACGKEAKAAAPSPRVLEPNLHR